VITPLARACHRTEIGPAQQKRAAAEPDGELAEGTHFEYLADFAAVHQIRWPQHRHRIGGF
jgi:hypothetical protein